MARCRIPSQDLLWLELDRPTNLMTIVAVLWTATPVSPAAVRALVAERLLGRYPVFRRRVVTEPLTGTAWWEDDPDFDIDRHVLAHRLPGAGDRAALQDFVARLRSTPLDRRHPLWSVHVLSGYGPGRKISTWANPRTALAGEPGVEKAAVWSDPVPLDRLRAIAAEAHATVADVCTALVAGAVGRYLAEHGAARDVDLAWMVPVNLVPVDERLPESLGNHFALVLAVLPHGPMPMRERIADVHRRMADIRDSYEPTITFALSRGIALAPPPLARRLGDVLAAKATGVLTNVPGPRARMTLVGAPVEGMVAWAPCSGRQALTVCVVSYAGSVTFGFGTDRAVIGDPDRLLAALDAELASTTTSTRS